MVKVYDKVFNLATKSNDPQLVDWVLDHSSDLEKTIPYFKLTPKQVVFYASNSLAPVRAAAFKQLDVLPKAEALQLIENEKSAVVLASALPYLSDSKIVELSQRSKTFLRKVLTNDPARLGSVPGKLPVSVVENIVHQSPPEDFLTSLSKENYNLVFSIWKTQVFKAEVWDLHWLKAFAKCPTVTDDDRLLDALRKVKKPSGWFAESSFKEKHSDVVDAFAVSCISNNVVLSPDRVAKVRSSYVNNMFLLNLAALAVNDPTRQESMVDADSDDVVESGDFELFKAGELSLLDFFKGSATYRRNKIYDVVDLLEYDDEFSLKLSFDDYLLLLRVGHSAFEKSTMFGLNISPDEIVSFIGYYEDVLTIVTGHARKNLKLEEFMSLVLSPDFTAPEFCAKLYSRGFILCPDPRFAKSFRGLLSQVPEAEDELDVWFDENVPIGEFPLSYLWAREDVRDDVRDAVYEADLTAFFKKAVDLGAVDFVEKTAPSWAGTLDELSHTLDDVFVQVL